MDLQTTTEARGVGSGLEAQKYVLFGLAGETYGLSLLQLQEILAAYEYTVTPNLPDYFHGVIGVRGEVIPVLNLRQRFGFPRAERDKRNRVIVVDLTPNPIGVQVDEVFRVVTVREDQIEAAPELTCGQRIPYVTGVSERESGKLVIHLDMQKVLSSMEKIHLAEITEALRNAHSSSPVEGGSEDTADSSETPIEARTEDQTEEGRNRSEPLQSTGEPQEADNAPESVDGQAPQEPVDAAASRSDARASTGRKRRARKNKSKKPKSDPRTRDMESDEPGKLFVDFVLSKDNSTAQDATPATTSESNAAQASDPIPDEQEDAD